MSVLSNFSPGCPNYQTFHLDVRIIKLFTWMFLLSNFSPGCPYYQTFHLDVPVLKFFTWMSLLSNFHLDVPGIRLFTWMSLFSNFSPGCPYYQIFHLDVPVIRRTCYNVYDTSFDWVEIWWPIRAMASQSIYLTILFLSRHSPLIS